jgi:PAS domain S-box-containing protein
MNKNDTKGEAGYEPTASFTSGNCEADARMYALDQAETPVARVASKSEEKRDWFLRALTVTVVAGIFVADYLLPADVMACFLYATALLPALLIRSRRWLWGVAVVSLPLTLVATMSGPLVTTGEDIVTMWSNRTLAILSMFCLCAVLDRHLVNRERLRIALQRESEAHEVERAVRRAAETAALQLHLSLKAGKAGVFDWDSQSDRTRWSDELLELYGIRREEFSESTKDWLVALFPEDRERAIAARERSLHTGQFKVDFRIVRRDNGAIRWVHSCGQVFFKNGKPDRMLGINVDITEQKHVEAALAARTEELRQTFNGSATGLTHCSRDLRYLEANPAYAQIAGVPLQEIIGHPIVEVMGEEGLETIRPYVDRVLSGESVLYERFVPFSASGPRFLHVAYTPLRDFDGSVGGWIASVTDVTARWKAEECLKAAGRQKDEFLAMLAHELRNPLASISNASELLRRAFAPEPKARRALAILQRQISQLTHLVDDLLDVSRIAQGRINLAKETIEIGAVIDQAVETVQPLVKEKLHRLNLRKPFSPVYVSGDFARLVQSFGNILHNAAKYTDTGGEIDVDVQELNGDLTIAVRDSGVGIAPELLPNVFDLFVQSPRTLDRSQGGLGIGLTIVKRLIQMHGGTVSAKSAGPGSGSTFTIHLPTVSASGASESKDVHCTVPPRRVLVVDDNEDAANSLAELLRLEGGHDVSTAYSGSDALSAVEHLKPEVVFLDIGLPQMDGYEVARRLRIKHATACPRLIALTGYGQAEDKARALATGFSEHLTKPVDHEQLRRVLSDHWDAAAG